MRLVLLHFCAFRRVYYTGSLSLSTHSKQEADKCLDGPGGPLCLSISRFELMAAQGQTVHSSANNFSREALHQTALDENHTEMQPSSFLLCLSEESKWIYRGFFFFIFNVYFYFFI